MEPSHYVGLDVSLEFTAVCVVDQQGATVWHGVALGWSRDGGVSIPLWFWSPNAP